MFHCGERVTRTCSEIVRMLLVVFYLRDLVFEAQLSQLKDVGGVGGIDDDEEGRCLDGSCSDSFM